jgi:EAL domain-containing protein (putative c-di-GMP-specific phosphodiesterase class I)
MLKIDRAFVDQLPGENARLAQAIVQLAHTLELVPIAEGVENARQAEHLARLGCDLAQGFHLGRPADAAVARSRIQESNAAVSIAS